VVIGDTPKDVTAATAIGAESVGVGTGSFTPEQLVSAGATRAFSNLAAPGAMEAVLGALR
jgi:phosphoglycolate phosphatase-like HAD superfamily hydrolase